jgi:uncharacterized protein (TIGR01319 family)
MYKNNNDLYLLIDFGSTFTKVLAVDLAKEEIAGRAQAPSTVQTNVLFGLQEALKKLTINGQPADENTLKNARKLACSSAAGGLCIVAVGLVPELTLEAARKAALGAGAKVVGSFAYELDPTGLAQIQKTACDIVLIVGGTDGGDKETILHNAKQMAGINLDVPYIVAGNRVVADQVKGILEASGKYVEKTENVLPELDKLNVEPARACIRDIFMKRIVHAKGIDKAQEYVGNILMPTPMATLKAAELIANGSGGVTGLGELMVVEVGGATTNIHSIASGENPSATVVYKGIPEPYAKRTVEGDLGIRYNAATILNIVGPEKLLHNVPGNPGITIKDLETAVTNIGKKIDFIPVSELDLLIDIGLARSAIEIAVERHAGTIKEVWGPGGIVKIQQGKDLTGLKTLIGTGGIFAFNPYPEKALEAALYSPSNPFSLKPQSPDFYIDRSYLLYGIGLLSGSEPEKALKTAKKYLNKLSLN